MLVCRVFAARFCAARRRSGVDWPRGFFSVKIDDDVQDDHERKGVECCTRERRAARRARAARAAPAPRRAGCSRRTPFFFCRPPLNFSACSRGAFGGAFTGVRRRRRARRARRSAAVSGVGGGACGSGRRRRRGVGGAAAFASAGSVLCEKFGEFGLAALKPDARVSTLPRCAPVIAYLVIKRRA